MRRSVPWALFALFPLAGLVYLSLVLPEDAANAVPWPLPAVPVVVEYWYLAFGVTVLVQIAYFLVHVARNHSLPLLQRGVWVILLVLVAPLGAPLYWWVHSAKVK